jgi:hypothetical protein
MRDEKRFEEAASLEWREIDRENALAESNETFDRIAFAMRLTRLLPPRDATVIFHESYRGVRVERGRDHRRGGGATWAMLGISRRASREHIALAVAELAGFERVPFVVDWLIRAQQS